MIKLKNLPAKIRQLRIARPITGKLLAGMAALFVVGMVAYLGFVTYQDKKINRQLSEGGCNKEIIQATLPYLQDGYTRQLQPHVEKILALPELNNDPNCLYIVATYEAGNGNVEQAKRYLERLEEVYSERRGFSPYFGKDTVSVDKLRNKITFVENALKQFQQNTDVFNSSSERR